jgi:DNA-binding transcriptional ArsR family regulator
MRPRPSLAAKSGVGEHTARESESAQCVRLGRASASHHLNILKNKGLLESKREGKMIFYALKHNRLTEIIECLDRCTIAH